jgi:SAM-dependent methyltransferase
VPLVERHRIEREKWDRLVPDELSEADVLPPGEDFHTTARGREIDGMVAAFLGDLRGKRVLEYGCGIGRTSVLLARSGADVSTFDLSPARVETTEKRAAINGLADSVHPIVAAGEALPYEDASFDCVVGRAILHHLDVTAGHRELLRVLRRGGKAAFVEPMGMNPLLSFARDHLPYPGKTPRGPDEPLDYADIEAWGSGFGEFRYEEVQLLSMVERALGRGRKIQVLRRADRALLARAPFLRRYCRHVVLYMTK